MRTVYLVSCVKKKKNKPFPAKELYDSNWFRKARAYVESEATPWFILSAKHGLLNPDFTIDPYNKTLNEMSTTGKREWAARVIGHLKQVVSHSDRIVLFAGECYRQFLVDDLSKICGVVEVPLKSLPIGKQLQWFKNRLFTCEQD